MVKIETALQIQKRALHAVKELDAIVVELQSQYSADDFHVVKRGVGISIGTIQMELLEPLYKEYPEIDDLKSIDL